MSSLRNPENETDSVESQTLKGYDVCSSAGEPYAAKSLIFSNMMPGVYIKCSDEYYTLVQRFVRLVLSPETAVGFLQGMASIPVDLFYVGRSYLDTENRYRNRSEMYRLSLLIKRITSEEGVMSELINIIFETFFSHVPEKTQNKLFSRIGGAITGRAVTNAIVSSKLIDILAGSLQKAIVEKRITLREMLKINKSAALVGNIMLLGGMAERAIYTADALKYDCPELYNKLYPKSLDLLYFLVESAMEPVVDLIKLREKEGQVVFNNVMEMVSDELRK